MISEQEIARNCFGRTLQRARQIAASPKNMLTKQCRYSEHETTLSAFVASSSGWADSYRVSVTLDEDADAVLDYSCTCPAYLEYEGMCKHCAALALSYRQEPASFFGFEARRAPATSESITAFMEQASRTARARRGARSSAGQSAGAVDIEPTLLFGYRSWAVQFRLVGPQGSYVMKDIGEFVDLMREGAWHSYGKKLAFPHTPSALTPRGATIARFLEQAIEIRRHVGGYSYSYWRNQAHAGGRSLDLSDIELIALLDACSESAAPLIVKGTDYGTRMLTEAHIITEDPQVTLELCRTGATGYTLERPTEAVVIGGADRLYLWIGESFYHCSPEFAQCAALLRAVLDAPEERLYLRDADLPRFCATMLPLIEEHLRLEATPEVMQDLDACRPVPCALEFYFDRTPEFVVCDAKAAYGTQRVPLFGATTGASAQSEQADTAGRIRPVRDEDAEREGQQLVERYFPLREQPSSHEAPVPAIAISDGDATAALLFGGLRAFSEAGAVFTTPAFDRLISDKHPRIQTGLSLAGNLLNLTVSSDDLPPDELAALLASYRHRKTYHRLKSGAFLDLAGFELAELERAADDLGITSEQFASGSIDLPVYQAFYLDETLAEAQRDGSFMRYVEGFRAIDESSYRPPARLEGVLRPYQEAGFRWLSALSDHGFGGILADEMGLGKSAQLIAFLLSRRTEAHATGPSLIVCPASLVYNWLAEFTRFAPELGARAITGTKRERERIRIEAFEGARPADVLVTSYDLLRIDADRFADRQLYCCALDEAQYIKNHATKTAKATKRINAHVRFALTGTPMENRPSEIWSIFDFLMPGLLGSYARFRERFELDVLGGNENAARRLHALVGPFMLRRLKADVLSELPDKLETKVYAQMEGEQRKLYDAHEQRIRETLTAQKSRDFQGRKIEILAELTRLRQLCCDPHLVYENYTGPSAKMDALIELVESAADAGEKTLVFSQFTSFLSLIAAQLDRRGLAYYTITGATPKKKRLELVNAFNEDATPVFLISLKAGGTGLNLTGASVVVHADPWWNIAAQNQATDRAHRIGQTKIVNVCEVIAKDTIEERILRLQEEKAQIAEQIIGGDAVSLASLTAEDLLELLTS